jgi:hypothetical protein
MPTYRIGDVDPAAPWRRVPQRPLSCEQCGVVLGSVPAVHPHASMTGASVRGVFPEARPAVDRHEQECPSRESTIPR